MIRVETQDGLTLTGASAAAIVRQMRNMSWQGSQAKGDYMLDVARRVEDMTGIAPREALVAPGRAGKLLRYLEQVHLVRIDYEAPDPPERPASADA